MKPLLLELQAFGPFAQRQSIDFRELGAKTFFLIHGPTGSGKTSLLDGICFALFGDSSGGEREGRQMRSHHADGATLTEVRFSFALGAAVYRVRRVPEQMRKARRGGGETKQLPVAELCRIQTAAGVETEQPLASGWSKVTEAVVALLGFESQQFRQVIVLPQGKFFEFLKSSSQEREKILQALFGTELYKRIEDQLKLGANELSRQAERVRTQRQTLLELARAENDAALEVRHKQQTEELTLRRAAENAEAGTAQAAERALAEARRLADRFHELDQATASLQLLRGQEVGWAVKRARLGDARRAVQIQPHAEALAVLDRQLAAETTRCRALAASAAAASEAHAEAQAALARQRLRAPEAEQITARIAQLDAWVEKVAALASARAGHLTATADAGRSVAASAKAKQAWKDAAQRLQKIGTALQEHRVQAAGLDGLKARHSQLTVQLGQGTALAARLAEQSQAATQVEHEQTRLKGFEAREVEARAERDRLRVAWVAGQAARLADALVEGQPCPVCGGLDHPAAARPGHPAAAGEPRYADELVSDARLQAAENAASKVETDLRAAVQRLAAAQQAAGVLEARILELRAALGAALGAAPAAIETSTADAEAARVALLQAEAATRALKELESSLPAAQQAAVDAEAAAIHADAATQAAQARLLQMSALLSERGSGMPAELTEPAALSAARSAALRTSEAFRQALDTATATASDVSHQLTKAKTQLEAGEATCAGLARQRTQDAAALQARLQATAFADLDAYKVAQLDTAAIESLHTAIEVFTTSLASAGERHLRAAEATRDLTRPDLAALSSQHEIAKAAHLAASNAVRDVLAVFKTTGEHVASLQRLAAEYLAVEARYTVLKEVSDVAGGANAQRMSFQRYVLATLLEEVLVATTLRLSVMSRGRYEMRRKLQAADQRAAAGLDLEVFDQYTGTTRGVSTLSGGESFLASLALALGLSDVVQAYAGGIRLDAIFVDEGFGTLDPEALDFAVRALQDLQQAGRMVGIISHVAELKEWIDARLELQATRNGSVAAFRL